MSAPEISEIDFDRVQNRTQILCIHVLLLFIDFINTKCFYDVTINPISFPS